jgi:bacteriorhodopsin
VRARTQADSIFQPNQQENTRPLIHDLHAVHRQQLSTIFKRNAFSFGALGSELNLHSNSTVGYWFQREGESGIPYLALVFLAIGFGLMAGASIYFLVAALRFEDTDVGPTGPLYHYIAFFITAVCALSYYAMWNGFGVVEDDEERIIFLSRYADRVLTTPLIIAALTVLGKAPLASIVALLGCDLLMVGAGFVGMVLGTTHRFFWWGIEVAFFGILVYLLLQELRKATQQRGVDGEAGEALAMLTFITIASWTVYPLLWLFGQEGVGLLSLNVQVCFEMLADLSSKLIFGAILVQNAPSGRGRFSTFV